MPLSELLQAGALDLRCAVNAQKSSASILKVLVVEDSAEIQALLQAMLGEIPSVEVIAMVDTESSAIQALRSGRADLAIVDLELQSGTGLSLLKSLSEPRDTQDRIKVVVFSNYSNMVIRHRCLSLGAKAFFDKSFQIDELLEFVQAEASGKSSSVSA